MIQLLYFASENSKMKPRPGDNKAESISVVMVSGGHGKVGDTWGNLDSVELLNIDGTWNCPMPSMPEPRSCHTQSGPVICGGWDLASNDRKSCVTFFSGDDNWVKTHNLTKDRRYHSAWASPRGVMLMGGRWAEKTTEILTEDGDTKPGFNVYRTK